MALGTMAYTKTTVDGEITILKYADYVGKAITLDAGAFTSGLCKAGTPINANGAKATTSDGASNAVGILLHDVVSGRPQGTIVIGGYIDTAAVTAHASITYDAATKAALKNVVFC